VLNCLLTIVLVIGLVPPLQPVNSLPAQTRDESARLLLHQMVGGVRIYPQTVRDNISWIENNREFLDGVIMHLGYPSSAVMKNKPLSYATVAKALAPVNGLHSPTLNRNFAIIFNDNCADPFDDWTICIDNWVTFATAVKDAGLAGIAFDNEEYFERWTNYPDDCAYPEKSLQEYQEQVRLRGRQIMEAVTAEFPGIEVITFQGAYLSEPATPSQVGNLWIGEHAARNELKGPFFAGFLEGAGPHSLIIDGGGAYGLRYPEEFAELYSWRKYGISSCEVDSAFIPPYLRPIWRERINLAWGVYNRPWRGKDMNENIMEQTVLNALNQTDKYIWLYFERADLVSPGGIEPGWADAIRRAKEAHSNAVEALSSFAEPDQP
jgi:hypothetical protein